jgi:hypothetical protein
MQSNATQFNPSLSFSFSMPMQGARKVSEGIHFNSERLFYFWHENEEMKSSRRSESSSRKKKEKVEQCSGPCT